MTDYKVRVRKCKKMMDELVEEDTDNMPVGPAVMLKLLIDKRAFTINNRVTREDFVYALLEHPNNPFRADGTTVRKGETNGDPLTPELYIGACDYVNNEKRRRMCIQGTASKAVMAKFYRNKSTINKVNARYMSARDQLKKLFREGHDLKLFSYNYVLETVRPPSGIPGDQGIIIPATIGDTTDAISSASSKITTLEDKIKDLEKLRKMVS